ncbi:MAG: hypothetical protein IJ188_01250 [Clostridia bacterium]|nr:hypothetical protein [Clostridia bacterium]
MKTPVNKQTLRQHLTYSWWKYALLIILGTLLVNLYFTVTAYRSPESKKVSLYIYGYGNEAELNAYMARVQEEQMPDMEEMNALLLATDATYGPMQLSTYVAAGEGDVYLLPRDQFVSLATSGAWLPLEEEEELTSLFTERDISLQSGWRRDSDTGESHLFGIPIAKLPGLEKLTMVENGYLAVLVTNGNDDNVLQFLKIFCEDMLQE